VTRAAIASLPVRLIYGCFLQSSLYSNLLTLLHMTTSSLNLFSFAALRFYFVSRGVYQQRLPSIWDVTD